jgi:gas vesicle protein
MILEMKGETFFALLAGAVAGLTIGLLFAPDSGEETRRKVREAAGEGWDRAKEKASEFYGQAREETSDALDKLKARGRLARMEFKELRDSLKDQAAGMTEEARKKLLEQLEKLENALRVDDQSETENA